MSPHQFSLPRLVVAVALAAGLGGCSSSDDPVTDPVGGGTISGGSAGTSSGTAVDDGASGGADTGAGTAGGSGVDSSAGGTANDASADDVVNGILSLGIVVVANSSDVGEDSSTATGVFVDLGDSPASSAEVAAAFGASDDRCFVSRDDEDTGITVDGIPDFENIGSEIPFVDAGDALTLTSPAGTWATLVRQEVFGFVLYSVDNDDGSIAGFLPTGLVLDIPGAVFPAFTGIAVPDVPPALDDISPAAGSTVGMDASFVWMPSGIADARIFLDVESDSTSISCLLQDDGAYRFTPDVAAEAGANFAGRVDSASRQGLAIHSSDRAVLFVTSGSDDDAGLF